jgi:CBS domain-containing protein
VPLKNYLERDLIACSPETPIETVAELMRDNDVGAVLVIANGEPRGILTDRDLVLRCIADKKNAVTTLAGEIMSRPVETVTLNDGIYNVVEKMKLGEVRRIPVVDKAGKAVALLSFEDVFELLANEVNDLKAAIRTRRPTKLTTQAA